MLLLFLLLKSDAPVCLAAHIGFQLFQLLMHISLEAIAAAGMPKLMYFKSSMVGLDITGVLGTGKPASAAACIASPDMRLQVAALVKSTTEALLLAKGGFL